MGVNNLSKQKDSAHHFARADYKRGVCGAYGMLNRDPKGVTCDRCKKTAVFKAALNIHSRFAGARA